MRAMQNRHTRTESFMKSLHGLSIAHRDHEPEVGGAGSPLPAANAPLRSGAHGVTRPTMTARFMECVWLMWVAAVCLVPVLAGGAAEDLKASIQRGLFEEEANHNLPAAITAYQAVLAQFDKDRELAATAVFRMGECYRKQEKTNEAAACYQRIVREFPDLATLARLSQQNLLAVAPASVPTLRARAADARQASLIQEEIKLAEQQLAQAKQRFEAGLISQSEALKCESDLLRLRRELSAAQGTDIAEQKKLLLQEIGLAEKVAEMAQRRAATGTVSTEEVTKSRRELLGLKRELAALEAAPSEGAPLTDEEEREIRRIQALIQNSPDLINAPGTNGLTPLHQAVAAGYLSVARFLLANKADVNAVARQGRFATATALHIAARGGNKAMAELLLDHGAQVNAKGDWMIVDSTPLLLAAWYGYQAVAEVLLARQADVNLGPAGGFTPLDAAAQFGFTALAEFLIQHGARVDAPTDQGWTPMHYAAEGGSLAMGELLLAQHVPADAKAKDGTTPLAVAVEDGQAKFAEFLLRHGAAVEAVDGAGLTPLQKAVVRTTSAASGSQPELVRSLLKAGADPNKPFSATGAARTVRRPNPGADMDTTGATPLLIAAFLGDAPVVEALVAGGADVNARSVGGMTPLLNAVDQKSLRMLNAILARKPDLESGTRDGSTPLWLAIESGEMKIAEKLTQAGANVNASLRRFNDFSLLHLAVFKGRPDFAALLLTNKAQVDVVNNRGQTPLDLAKEMIRDSRQSNRPALEEIAALLAKHGADENFTRRSCIAVARKENDLNARVFTKGTNDWNRYTLLELIATVFASPNESPARSLPFPDLSRVTIRRLGSEAGQPPIANQSAGRTLVVDVATLLNAADGAPDPWLEWGDSVEIPERDHPVNESWNGLAQPVREALTKCLKREVEIMIKGQSQKVTLKPSLQGPVVFGGMGVMTLTGPSASPGTMSVPPPAGLPARLPRGPGGNPPEPSLIDLNCFRLNEVLRQSGLLRVSSDLARVRLTRTDPATKKFTQWIVDRSPGVAFAPQTDLWLRDGDLIEVPDKGADFTPRKEASAGGSAPAK
jgi:ankyrin repeat protein